MIARLKERIFFIFLPFGELDKIYRRLFRWVKRSRLAIDWLKSHSVMEMVFIAAINDKITIERLTVCGEMSQLCREHFIRNRDVSTPKGTKIIISLEPMHCGGVFCKGRDFRIKTARDCAVSTLRSGDEQSFLICRKAHMGKITCLQVFVQNAKVEYAYNGFSFPSADRG